VRPSRLVPLLLVFVLATTILEVDPAGAVSAKAASAPTSTTTATATVDDTQRPDQVSAQLLARRSGHRVEITGLRTKGTTTFANPDIAHQMVGEAHVLKLCYAHPAVGIQRAIPGARWPSRL
jgi:hypothetical protein